MSILRRADRSRLTNRRLPFPYTPAHPAQSVKNTPRFGGAFCGRLQITSNLREMSDDELASWIACWKPETRHYIVGMRELRRRESEPASTRAWVAIGIAALALIISLIALFGAAT